MSEEPVRLRPRHVAGVWGTAMGQFVSLVRDTWDVMTEFGAAEEDIPAGAVNEFAIRFEGQPPKLEVGQLRGETFDEQLPAAVIQVQPQPSTEAGVAKFTVIVDEQRGRSVISGDIYRGDVRDERGVRVASLALDAGS